MVLSSRFWKLKLAERKLVDLKDWSLGNIICINVIKKKENETWAGCKQELHSFFWRQTSQRVKCWNKTSTPNKEVVEQWKTKKAQNNNVSFSELQG